MTDHYVLTVAGGTRVNAGRLSTCVFQAVRLADRGYRTWLLEPKGRVLGEFYKDCEQLAFRWDTDVNRPGGIDQLLNEINRTRSANDDRDPLDSYRRHHDVAAE